MCSFLLAVRVSPGIRLTPADANTAGCTCPVSRKRKFCLETEIPAFLSRL